MSERFNVENACRLDKFLANAMGESRNQIETLIRLGCVTVNDTVVTKNGFALKPNDYIVTTALERTQTTPTAIDFDVEVLYEDEALIVLNKPYNLTVHKAPSVQEPTLVDWLRSKNISLSTIANEERNGIVHRLDKGTSGAIVVAKTNSAHTKLAAQLENKTMGRYYLAIIDMPLKTNCIVENFIGRNPKNRLKMDVVSTNGKYAKTSFVKLATSNNGQFELIAAKLFTGRTHQIRVHLQTLQRHIYGDTLYGFKGATDTIKRFFLHAYCIYFTHPITNIQMSFIAPLHRDMIDFLNSKFTEEVYDHIDQNSLIDRFNICT